MIRPDVLTAEEAALAEHADIEPQRLDRLRKVAVAYGEAVGIIDVLRIQNWSEDGLTIAQLRLLWTLREDDGLPVGALAEHLGVNPSTITGHVDRLVRQGLVRREEDPSDRRIVRNYLTDEGQMAVGVIRRIAGVYVINILKRLSDEQLDRLEQALADLNRAAAEARYESQA
ncbi:MAG: MarR family transcriptional regulator [Dehalococcoidia bacterium]